MPELSLKQKKTRTEYLNQCIVLNKEIEKKYKEIQKLKNELCDLIKKELSASDVLNYLALITPEKIDLEPSENTSDILSNTDFAFLYHFIFTSPSDITQNYTEEQIRQLTSSGMHLLYLINK